MNRPSEVALQCGSVPLPLDSAKFLLRYEPDLEFINVFSLQTLLSDLKMMSMLNSILSSIHIHIKNQEVKI